MRSIQIVISIIFISCCLSMHSILHADTATQSVNKVTAVSNIDNEKLQQLVKQGVLVVDIRRQEEWQHTGIIEGSKTITFFDKSGRISPGFLPKFTAIAKKDQPVVLICRSGARTRVASQAIAEQLGYKKVINVTHGIISWMAEKRPVSKYSK